MYLNILNWVGSIASAISGVWSARRYTENRLAWFAIAMLNVFGGNILIRDLAILHTKPAILDEPYEIMLMSCFITAIVILAPSIARVSSPYDTFNEWPRHILLATDCVSMFACAIIGYERGMNLRNSPLTGILCGFGTMVGTNALTAIMIRLQSRIFSSRN